MDKKNKRRFRIYDDEDSVYTLNRDVDSRRKPGCHIRGVTANESNEDYGYVVASSHLNSSEVYNINLGIPRELMAKYSSAYDHYLSRNEPQINSSNREDNPENTEVYGMKHEMGREREAVLKPHVSSVNIPHLEHPVSRVSFEAPPPPPRFAPPPHIPPRRPPRKGTSELLFYDDECLYDEIPADGGEEADDQGEEEEAEEEVEQRPLTSQQMADYFKEFQDDMKCMMCEMMQAQAPPSVKDLQKELKSMCNEILQPQFANLDVMLNRLEKVEQRISQMEQAAQSKQSNTEAESLRVILSHLKGTLRHKQKSRARISMEREEVPKRQPSKPGCFEEKTLLRIAKMVGKEQFQLCLLLGVAEEEYTRVQDAFPRDPVRVSYRVLKLWRDSSKLSDKEKVKELTDAFLEAGRHVTNQLREIISPHYFE